MNSRVLIAGVIGGVTIFLLGYVIYGLLLADMMAGCSQCQRAMEDINFLLLALGNLFIGTMIAYILSRFAGVVSFGSGATVGAILGFLMTAGWTSISYATSTVFSSPNCIFYQLIAEVIMWSIAGGIIGWWYGRGKTPTVG